MQELFDAKVDGEAQSKYKELLITHIELTMVRNVASLQTLRQGLEVDAAQQRLELADPTRRSSRRTPTRSGRTSPSSPTSPGR